MSETPSNNLSFQSFKNRALFQRSIKGWAAWASGLRLETAASNTFHSVVIDFMLKDEDVCERSNKNYYDFKNRNAVKVKHRNDKCSQGNL